MKLSKRISKVIQVKNVSCSYKKEPVLKSISLSVSSGEILTLLGPSGCGKTTLLRTIAGLHNADQGQIQINSKVVLDTYKGLSMAPETRGVGMVFQDGALFPHLTVRENILFGLKSHSDKESLISESLKMVGLLEYADRYPNTLSGGQKQRVALARALAPKPSVLLLDEPFSALDTSLRSQIRSEVKQILSEVNCSTILVTHDQDEAFLLGDTVGVMDNGEILQLGSPGDIYETPNSPWISSFAGEANIFEGKASDGFITTSIGQLPLNSDLDGLSEKNLKVVVRPEQLQIVVGNASKITDKSYFGHDVLYVLSNNDSKEQNIEVRSTSNLFSVGDSVDIKFVGESVTGWQLD